MSKAVKPGVVRLRPDKMDQLITEVLDLVGSAAEREGLSIAEVVFSLVSAIHEIITVKESLLHRRKQQGEKPKPIYAA